MMIFFCHLSVDTVPDFTHSSVDFINMQEYTEDMEYEFSFGWAFMGLIVMVVATIVLRFHQQIADAMGAGVVDYERYKLYSLVAIIVGFLTTLNLVPFLLFLVASSLFGGGTGEGL